VVELSTGFISLPVDDLIRLVKKVVEAGLKAKPELGIQFGAGGDTPAEALQAEGTRDVQWVIDQANRCLDAGASIIMIESEGITENVVSWRTDAVARIINAVGLEKTMFKAADPAGLRMVREELRHPRQPVCESQSDRPARVPALRHLGHQEHLGARARFRGLTPRRRRETVRGPRS
jgi:(2R)-phospho-3-sulfolactate synthase (ComA)